MDLEKPSFDFEPPADRRPKMPEPPPVRLVAVEDVTLEATAEDMPAIENLYLNLLKFERDEKADGVVYKAENLRLQFILTPAPILRDDMRAVGIEVPSLADLELLLVEQQITFTKERSLTLGHVTFLLRDPGGNWLRIGQVKRIL